MAPGPGLAGLIEPAPFPDALEAWLDDLTVWRPDLLALKTLYDSNEVKVRG